MNNEPTITLYCISKNGRRDTTKLTHHTLPVAREVAKWVLQAGNGRYSEIDVCTEDGKSETIRSTAPAPTAPAPEVLLVEDNAGDALLIGQALTECQISVHLHIARDGEQALQILKEPDFHPDLVILDLNIPKISGHTVLSLYQPKKTAVIVFKHPKMRPTLIVRCLWERRSTFINRSTWTTIKTLCARWSTNGCRATRLWGDDRRPNKACKKRPGERSDETGINNRLLYDFDGGLRVCCRSNVDWSNQR
jgi:CheY-like chemotaxis protein